MSDLPKDLENLSTIGGRRDRSRKKKAEEKRLQKKILQKKTYLDKIAHQENGLGVKFLGVDLLRELKVYKLDYDRDFSPEVVGDMMPTDLSKLISSFLPSPEADCCEVIDKVRGLLENIDFNPFRVYQPGYDRMLDMYDWRASLDTHLNGLIETLKSIIDVDDEKIDCCQKRQQAVDEIKDFINSPDKMEYEEYPKPPKLVNVTRKDIVQYWQDPEKSRKWPLDRLINFFYLGQPHHLVHSFFF